MRPEGKNPGSGKTTHPELVRAPWTAIRLASRLAALDAPIPPRLMRADDKSRTPPVPRIVATGEQPRLIHGQTQVDLVAQGGLANLCGSRQAERVRSWECPRNLLRSDDAGTPKRNQKH